MKLVVAGVCVALLLVVPASAQDHSCVKGALEIGGTVGFDMQSYKHKDADDPSVKYTSITIMPVVGKFFSDNLELELMPILSMEKAKFPMLDDYSVTNTQFGAIVRGAWHFVSEGTMVPYVAVGFGFLSNSQSYSDDTPEPDLKASMLLPEVAGGIKAFLSERVAIKAEVFVDMITNAGGAEDVTNTEFGIRAGVAAFHIM
jgi:hypothetical protein